MLCSDGLNVPCLQFHKSSRLGWILRVNVFILTTKTSAMTTTAPFYNLYFLQKQAFKETLLQRPNSSCFRGSGRAHRERVATVAAMLGLSCELNSKVKSCKKGLKRARINNIILMDVQSFYIMFVYMCSTV